MSEMKKFDAEKMEVLEKVTGGEDTVSPTEVPNPIPQCPYGEQPPVQGVPYVPGPPATPKK